MNSIAINYFYKGLIPDNEYKLICTKEYNKVIRSYINNTYSLILTNSIDTFSFIGKLLITYSSIHNDNSRSIIVLNNFNDIEIENKKYELFIKNINNKFIKMMKFNKIELYNSSTIVFTNIDKFINTTKSYSHTNIIFNENFILHKYSKEILTTAAYSLKDRFSRIIIPLHWNVDNIQNKEFVNELIYNNTLLTISNNVLN
jgi:hypothetical protein